MKHSYPRVGVAIGGTAITGVVRVDTAVRIVTVPLAAADAARSGAVLHDAFAELHARLSAEAGRDLAGAVSAITLLPPHADARLVALPPLRRTEAEAVIRRDAARHFIGAAGVRVVAVRMPHALGRRASDGAPVLAVAATALIIDAARAAAAAVGWRVTSHTAAHGVWLALAQQSARRGTAGGATAFVAIDGDTAHVLRLERGAVTLLRRLPAHGSGEITAALGAGPGSVSLFADGVAAERFADDLAAAGWTVVRASTAASAAAQHATLGGLALVPADMIAAREQQQRTRALRLAAAAVLLVIATAVVHVWGAQRELHAVRAQRAALRAEVMPLIEARDSLDRLRERADAFRALSGSTQWTRALFDVALLLPADAHVISLRGTGDTLVVSAQGDRAGAALQALRGAGSLRSVQLRGPVEREIEDGATTLERFTLDARLAADSAQRRSP